MKTPFRSLLLLAAPALLVSLSGCLGDDETYFSMSHASAETASAGSAPKESSPAPAQSLQADYYVCAGKGSDQQEGSLERPFRTIQKAASVAQAGQVVCIRQGVYRESVRPAHSGKEGQPIVFVAMPEEIVEIRGTEVLKGWKKGSSGTYSVSCPEFKSLNNQALQVFVDGKMVPESRYPDQGEDMVRSPMLEVEEVVHVEKIGEYKFRTTFKTDQYKQPKGRWDGASISIRPMWEWGWGMQRTGTVVASEPGQLVVDLENYEWEDPVEKGGSVTVIRKGSTFFVFGGPVANIDQAGEWIYEKDSSTLTLRPPLGVDMASSVVEVKQRDWAFDLSERSDITIRGVHLFGCSITTDVASGTGIGELHPDTQVRHDVAPSSRILIDSIRARYVTHFTALDGYVLSQWSNNSGIVLSGRDHVLQNSVIAYSAGNGVTLIGERHRVHNNIIHHVGYSGAETGAVGCGSWKTPSYDHQISYNTAYTIGGNGMHLGFKTKDPATMARVNNNIISDVGLLRVDIGYVYFCGGEEEGLIRRFDHNLMFSCTSSQGYGIYSDFGTSWMIDHNIVLDTSWASCVHVNDDIGHNVKWYNNTLLGLGHSMQGLTHAPARKVEVCNNILIPRLDKAEGTVFSYNFQSDDHGMILALFESPETFDFTPRATATQILAQGQALGEYTEGLEGQGFQRETPDIGAVQKGGAPVRYGSSLPPVVAGPDGLRAQWDDGKVSLTWNDHADNEKHYIVERGHFLDPGFLFHVEWQTLAVLPADSNAYTDATPPESRPILYRVRAPEALPSNMAFIRQ